MHLLVYLQLYFEVNIYTTPKASKIYMWNVKQKDDGMDQNALFCCYGDYVTTNQ